MKFKFLKAAVAGLVLSVSSFANAGIIQTDYLNSGDNQLTLDQSNGLEWLDLSFTRGITANSALLQFGSTGFRVATGAELLSLYISAGVDAVTDYSSTPTVVYGTAVNAWNNNYTTQGVSNLATLYNYINGGAFSSGWIHGYLAKHNATQNYLGRLGVWSSTSGSAHINNNGTSYHHDRQHSSIATFLVRETSTDVPEPSTLAIFALGMIGLASRRFKKQS